MLLQVKCSMHLPQFFIIFMHVARICGIISGNFQKRTQYVHTATTAAIKDVLNKTAISCGSECMNDDTCVSLIYHNGLQICCLYSVKRPGVNISSSALHFIDRCPSSLGFTYDTQLELCYWFSALAVTWHTANLTCHDKQATLVKIDSEEKREFYRVAMDSLEYLWIGASDLELEGTFVWSDGEILHNDDDLWDSGQPHNYKNKNHCVLIQRYDTVIYLHDARCSLNVKFACQYDV